MQMINPQGTTKYPLEKLHEIDALLQQGKTNYEIATLVDRPVTGIVRAIASMKYQRGFRISRSYC